MTQTSSAIIVAIKPSMKYAKLCISIRWATPSIRHGRSSGQVTGLVLAGSGWCRLAGRPFRTVAWGFGDGPAGRGGGYQAVCGGAGERPAFPLLVFHGGPGLDHTGFGGCLDPLTEGGSSHLVLADARACGRSDRAAPRGTWTRGRMAGM